MATLNDSFTVEDLKELDKRLNYIFYYARHENTRLNAGANELQLMYIIENLCKTSGMLCDLIEQHLEGQIVTFDPYSYLESKLSTAETGMKNFLKVMKIDLD